MKTPRPVLLAWAWLVLAVLLLGWAGCRGYRDRVRVWREVAAGKAAEARHAAGQIDAQLAALEAVAEDLAQELETRKLSPEAIQAQVIARLGQAPAEATRLRALFLAGALGPGRFGPCASRGDGVRGYRFGEAEPAGPAVLERYRQALGGPGWSEPHPSLDRELVLVDYVRPFRLPGAPGPSGVVQLQVSLEKLQALVKGLVPQYEGAGSLLSAQGVFLADPRRELVLAGRNATAVARELGDAGWMAIAAAARQGARAFARSVSEYPARPVWLYLEPIVRNHWALAVALFQDELPLTPAGWSRDLVGIVSAGLLLGWAALFLGFRGWTLEAGRLWRIAIGGSLLTAGAIGILLQQVYALPEHPVQQEVRMMAPQALEDFKRRHARLQVGLRQIGAEFIPTGVYLQTVEATAPGLMKLTGLIWQKLPRDTPRDRRGVVLPELVSGEVTPGQEVAQGDRLVQFYGFRAVVREELDQNDLYPFDRTRLRLWPRSFYGNQVLVPDLDAYGVLAPSALPGVDPEIELPGWILTGTEFAFTAEHYNTNFGVSDFARQRGSPELLFNLSIKRHFLSPLIVAFLPLLAVAGLLFILLLAISRDPEKVKATSYNFLNLLRTVIALFFSLIVAQFNLRGRITANGVLYLEWFYFVLYGAILLVSGLALQFALGGRGPLHAADHRYPKLAFWPLLLVAFYVIATGWLL